MDLDAYIAELRATFVENANPEQAKSMSQYMRNKFEFYGIKAKKRRKLSRKFMRQENRPDYQDLAKLIKRLWELPQRELHYFGWELVERYSNDFKSEIIELLEYMIAHQSWWDTVDMIAKKLVGAYFKKFSEQRNQYIEKWLKSQNLWLQRTAILFQLGYKEDTDVELLFEIVKRLKDIDEFFIQKAIGWALREYSRIESEAIEDFISNQDLSSLSEREGLKLIN